MAPIKHSPRARIMGPIAQVLGKPRYQVLTEQGFGLMLLSPTPLTLGQAKMNGANISLWAGHVWPNSAVLEQFQKLHRFPNFAATFSQNEIARFFQRPVISKITYLIN